MKILYSQKKPRKHPSKVYSDISYTPKSIMCDFHLDITPKSVKKANNVYSDILIRLKKMHKKVTHDVITNFCSRYFLYT